MYNDYLEDKLTLGETLVIEEPENIYENKERVQRLYVDGKNTTWVHNRTRVFDYRQPVTAQSKL